MYIPSVHSLCRTLLSANLHILERTVAFSLLASPNKQMAKTKEE